MKKEYGMDVTFMTQAQQSDAEWTLSAGQALRLAAAPTPRVLAITAGRVWLTRSAGRDRPAPDVWLAAGETATLAPGDEVVLEAWPRARFALLQAPTAAPRRISAARAASWASNLRERLQWTPRLSGCA
jgi:hypothetical protein